MCDELIKIKSNKFNLSRNSGSQLYSIVDDNNDTIGDRKVRTWFNNGFVLCEEHYEGCDYHKDHETYYDYYLYIILNNSLEEVYRIKTSIKDYFTYIDDFKYGCLPILEPQNGKSFGAINETGSLIIKLGYTLEEVLFRIEIIGYYLGLIIDKEQRDKIVAWSMLNFGYIENTYKIDDFIMNLYNTYQDIYEVLFHLFLHRDLYKKNEENERYRNFNSELGYYLERFDIHFILEFLIEKLGMHKNTYVVYNICTFNHSHFEKLILDYYPYDNVNLAYRKSEIENRKNHIIHLCDKISSLNFELSNFKIVVKKNMEKINSASPFVTGRQVLINEYLTLESNFTEKKYVGGRFFGIYKKPADFLDPQNYKNLHVVSDLTNSELYYIVEAKSVELCLLNFRCTYDDYVELLK